MYKNLVGAVYGSLAILSVGVMVIIGMISGSWDNLWLIPFGAMIVATVFAMFANVAGEQKSNKKSDKKSDKK